MNIEGFAIEANDRERLKNYLVLENSDPWYVSKTPTWKIQLIFVSLGLL